MEEKFLSRDPSGFVFKKNSKIYRAVNRSYQQNYDYLFSSGLYEKLTEENLLVQHTEVSTDDIELQAYKVISPTEIEFISYPYEWCFEQLKDAAIVTMLIQKLALEKNMSLKDASAFNIQFLDCKPILIDTLSFEIYKENSPWIAYKQFCQHFLAPLILMSYRDIRLNRLMSDFVDGLPLDLANSMLPLRSKLNPKILLHVSLHSKAQQKFKSKKANVEARKFSKRAFYTLIDSLTETVSSLKLSRTSQKKQSDWIDYYDKNIQSQNYLNNKIQLIKELLDNEKPNTLWDLGANIGTFSRIAAAKNIKVISFDSDPLTINKIYSDCKSDKVKNILPLFQDLTIPSPSLGWMNSERASLFERPRPELVMALALIHHLAIANNIPLSLLAKFFSKLSDKLIIEFVPKIDPNAKLLLLNREDIFKAYDLKNFELEFQKYFKIKFAQKLNESERVLYLFEKL